MAKDNKASKSKTNKKGKRASDDDEDDEERVEVGSGKNKMKVKKSTAEFFDFAADISAELDDVARRLHITEGSGDPGEPMSSGSLALDMVYGGGIRPAMYTHFGPEQSCKTTGALSIMAAAIKSSVGFIAFRDYEGSTANSMDYVQSLLKANGVKKTLKEVFGQRDDKTGKWIVPPIVRYAEETIGERFFDWLASALKRLPDKRKIANEWWLIYEDTKLNRAKLGEWIVSSMSKKYGPGLYVRAPHGALQGIVFVDSYPAMNPGSSDEKQEGDNSLALQARMFSKHLPRVKGRLSSKRVALIGVNQLRAIPMARYGPTEMEPGGQALRYNSDARLKFTPRSLSTAPFWPKAAKDSSNEFEPSISVENGMDEYRYIHVKGIKNKLGQPGRQAWIRLWIEDARGDALGFDQFFDTIWYLKNTGQLKGSGRSKLTLHLHDVGDSKRTVPWESFKRWVLGSKDDMRAISLKAGYKKPFDLRKLCFKQIADGTAETLYTRYKAASGVGKKTRDAEEA